MSRSPFHLPRAGNYTIGMLLLLGMILCITLGYQAQSRLASGLWFAAALLMLPLLITRAIVDDIRASVNKDYRDPSTLSRRPESGFVVTMDDHRVNCRCPSGEEDGIAWDDLDAVVIETNDTGPWGADVWWLLLGRDGHRCAVPQGATGDAALLDRLQSLPGFDSAKVIDAMASTDNQRFVCWRRPIDEPTPTT